MSNHVKTLEEARAQLVRARRHRAEDLLKDFGAHAAFVEIQTAIALVDAAIEDERKLALVGPVKGFSK